jgi:PmbA protein
MGNGSELVDSALETAAFGTSAAFQFPEPKIPANVDIFDDAVNNVSVKDMIGLGEAMITAITESTPGILSEATVSRGTLSVRILNSRGGQAEYRKSVFELGIEGTLIEGTDMLFVGDGDSSCRPITEPEGVITAVLRQLELARNQAKAPTRRLPVIFTPNGIASALIPPLMSACNGKIVLQGASPIGDKTGQRVFDEKLTIADDPTLAYRPGSRPCDDEAMPSRHTPLIEQGTVAGFLYDLQTGALAGRPSTGNGSLGRGGLPAPAPSAFTIAPGDTTFDEMVRDIEEGLVVEFLMGASQGNVLGGDFSGNVLLGYKIENGEITGRVKDTMVSGNIFQLLQDITAVGSEMRWVGISLLTPPIYLPGIAVASQV